MYSYRRFHSTRQTRGLNSPAGPVPATDQTGLREVFRASPEPTGQRASLEPGWSDWGRVGKRVRPYVSLSVPEYHGW